MGVTWWRLRETEIRETRGDLGRQGTLGETRKTEGDGGGLGEGSGRFGDGQGKLGEVCRSYLKKACQTDRRTWQVLEVLPHLKRINNSSLGLVPCFNCK